MQECYGSAMLVNHPGPIAEVLLSAYRRPHPQHSAIRLTTPPQLRAQQQGQGGGTAYVGAPQGGRSFREGRLDISRLFWNTSVLGGVLHLRGRNAHIYMSPYLPIMSL